MFVAFREPESTAPSQRHLVRHVKKFLTMSAEDDRWDDADLDSVMAYLV